MVEPKSVDEADPGGGGGGAFFFLSEFPELTVFDRERSDWEMDLEAFKVPFPLLLPLPRSLTWFW